MEQKLEITKTSKGDKEYNNLNLKTKVDKATGSVVQGLNVGNHIIVEKGEFAEGKEVGQYGSFLCNVKYEGVDVAFFLKDKEHPNFAACGGCGDKVKITMTSKQYTYNGKEGTSLVPVFEPVNDEI